MRSGKWRASSSDALRRSPVSVELDVSDEPKPAIPPSRPTARSSSPSGSSPSRSSASAASTHRDRAGEAVRRAQRSCTCCRAWRDWPPSRAEDRAPLLSCGIACGTDSSLPCTFARPCPTTRAVHEDRVDPEDHLEPLGRRGQDDGANDARSAPWSHGPANRPDDVLRLPVAGQVAVLHDVHGGIELGDRLLEPEAVGAVAERLRKGNRGDELPLLRIVPVDHLIEFAPRIHAPPAAAEPPRHRDDRDLDDLLRLPIAIEIDVEDVIARLGVLLSRRVRGDDRIGLRRRERRRFRAAGSPAARWPWAAVRPKRDRRKRDARAVRPGQRGDDGESGQCRTEC